LVCARKSNPIFGGQQQCEKTGWQGKSGTDRHVQALAPLQLKPRVRELFIWQLQVVA
jgi:hypothetical protein